MPQRWLLLGALVLAAAPAPACESCDFSFGPIPVVIDWTPADRPADVEVCAEGGCFVLHSEDQPDEPPGQVETHVGWQGYAACRYPALVVTIEADGCEPAVVERDREPLRKRGFSALVLSAELACD